MTKLIKGIALLTFYFPMRWFLLLLDRRQAIRIGRAIGVLHARFVSDELRRRVESGIRMIWKDIPEKRLNELLRRNLVTRYVHLIDLFLAPKLQDAIVRDVVPIISGKEHLDRALSGGKGVILLSSHFGSFGLIAPGLSFRGYQTALVKTVSPRATYQTWRWVEKTALNVKIHLAKYLNTDVIIWRPGIYVRMLYRKLLGGEVLIFHADVFSGENNVSVDFFKCRLLLSTVAFKLAARTRVQVIPAFVVRQSDNRHRIVLSDPITVNNDNPSGIQEAANRYASVLTKQVGKYPDHWFTFARLKNVQTENGDVFEIQPGWADETEFDAHQGGNQTWVNRMHAIKRWKQ